MYSLAVCLCALVMLAVMDSSEVDLVVVVYSQVLAHWTCCSMDHDLVMDSEQFETNERKQSSSVH